MGFDHDDRIPEYFPRNLIITIIAFCRGRGSVSVVDQVQMKPLQACPPGSLLGILASP